MIMGESFLPLRPDFISDSVGGRPNLNVSSHLAFSRSYLFLNFCRVPKEKLYQMFYKYRVPSPNSSTFAVIDKYYSLKEYSKYFFFTNIISVTSEMCVQ